MTPPTPCMPPTRPPDRVGNEHRDLQRQEHRRCGQHPPGIKIGASPNTPAINTATQTIYVAYGSAGNRIAVINAATCNATRTSGCGQAPAVIPVGAGTAVLGVSTATDTIYAPNSGSSSLNGDTMSVINGATCNGTNHSGCSHLAATVTVGSGPYGVTVDDRTHTVYVVNNADGDSPGTVSVINGGHATAPTPAAATSASPPWRPDGHRCSPPWTPAPASSMSPTSQAPGCRFSTDHGATPR